MNKTQLSYFLAAFYYRNLQKAAERTHVSRQALSKAIKEMEEQLGKQLFIRTTKGIEPTEAAKEIVPRAERILREYDAIMDSMTLGQLHEKEITVCTFDALAELFDSRFYVELLKECPHVLMNLEEHTDAGARDQLMMRQCDFAIVTDAVNVMDFEHTFLFHARYGIWVRDDDPLAEKSVIDFEDLQGRRIIGKSRKMQYYTRDTNYILEHSIRLDIVLELMNSGVVRRLVLDNVGIALAWDYSAAWDRTDGIVFRPLMEDGWGCDVYLISNKGVSQTLDQVQFERFLYQWFDLYVS